MRWRIRRIVTRNRHLAMLKSMFQSAVKWGLMRENPAKGIPKLRETGARTRFLDQEEIRRLLAAADEDFRSILITALHTAIKGECCSPHVARRGSGHSRHCRSRIQERSPASDPDRRYHPPLGAASGIK